MQNTDCEADSHEAGLPPYSYEYRSTADASIYHIVLFIVNYLTHSWISTRPDGRSHLTPGRVREGLSAISDT